MNGSIRAALGAALIMLGAGRARADGLSGSPASMMRQHQVAVREDYRFLRNPTEVGTLATSGALVPVVDNANLTLSKVSYPFARPEVRDFVERFAASYHEATGARLVVTSLTRPASAQPPNAHKLSVHPAGMAVDLRIPADSVGRSYIERALLEMEKAGVLDATRERSPAHYHIAVFAEAYASYAARQDSLAAIERRRPAASTVKATPAAPSATPRSPVESPSHAGLLLGMLALVGMTAPVMFRRSGSSPSDKSDGQTA